MEHMNLSYNNFNGTIPTQIGLLTEFKHLYIAMNGNIDSAGTISTEIGHLTKLRYLSFQKTNRIGMIPTEMQYLHELQFRCE